MKEKTNEQKNAPSDAACLKFAEYRELSARYGEAGAWEKMLEGFPEKQRERMGPFLRQPSLAEGFRQAVPFFRKAGMEMEVVDISSDTIDAALEIQKRCPYIEPSHSCGFGEPCHVICEMDIEASRRAFPEMQGDILCRIAWGSPVCIFKYQRKAPESRTEG